MKLLLRHIIRSIRKKPLQPIIIVLTLSLAMATSIFAFTIADTMESEVNATQMAKYGNAGLAISVGNTSDSRFLFADDVIDVLGESAIAVGCYEIPLILEGTGSTTVAVATEFEQINSLFDIEFLEYGKVTEGSVGDVAFISLHFAQTHQLSIGDSLQVETMGYMQSYRIEGISKLPLLAQYDVMVDISSLVRAFASNSLLFAAIGEDFKPCSKVYVNFDACEQFEDLSQVVKTLKSDSRFADKNFEDLDSIEKKQVNLEELKIVIKFAVALAALLSAVVIFCCFYILASERAEENQALVYAGAVPRLLNTMQYTEILLYWTVGVPLGILAAIPLVKFIPFFVDVQYALPSVRALSVFKSVLILLSVCLLTTAFFIITGKRARRTGTTNMTVSGKWIIYLLLLIAALFAMMYLVPAMPRFVLFIISMAAIIALIFVATPILIRRIASAIERRMRNVNKPSSIALRYALKNICSLKLLHNIVRLFALILAIILTVSMILICVCGQIKEQRHVFNADYVVFNATDNCYQKAQACQSTQAVYRAYLMPADIGTVVSADDPLVYADWFNIDRQANGNEAIVSSGISNARDLKVGDTFAVDLGGTEYEFVVSQIKKSASNYIAINCDDVGIPHNMLLVKGKDGVPSAELLGELSQATASELAPIVEAGDLLERFINAVQTYVDSVKILLVVFVFFSLIGMIDISYESLRARREEFELYRLAGMEKRELRLMKVFEFTISMLFGIVIGLGAFAIWAFAVNRGMSAYGMEVLLGILSWFK